MCSRISRIIMGLTIPNLNQVRYEENGVGLIWGLKECVGAPQWH